VKVCQDKSARRVEVEKSHGRYINASTEKQKPQTGWAREYLGLIKIAVMDQEIREAVDGCDGLYRPLIAFNCSLSRQCTLRR
jgi:hypothetical protein